MQFLINEGVDIDHTGICRHPRSTHLSLSSLLSSFFSRISHCYQFDIFLSADQFGNTPLLEAVKQGHERVAALLFTKGAKLNLKNAGSHLCTAVAKGDSDFIRRALAYGVDPNCRDYDHRTPLHIAAAEGLYLIAKMLVEAGASVFATDR